MKLICVGRNYAKHAEELNNPLPGDPILFLKPDTALLKGNKPFYLPDFSANIHHEIELVLRIGKLGKNIAPEFAHRYIDALALGVDFTARDLQNQQKEKGLPWEIAKAFDSSAPLSDMIPLAEVPEPGKVEIRLEVNGKTVQEGNAAQMLFSFADIIAYASRFFTLKTGDLIFTGTPAGVGPVKAGDHLQGYLNGKLMLDFEVK